MLFFRKFSCWWRQRVPVFSDLNAAGSIDDQHVAGGYLLNTTKEGLRRRSRDKRQVVIQRLFIYLWSHLRVFQNGFYLGRKYEPPVMVIEVKRLDPGAVARQHQAFTICVPERNRIIAFDLMNEIESQFFVEMQDGFRIGAGGVDVSMRF